MAIGSLMGKGVQNWLDDVIVFTQRGRTAECRRQNPSASLETIAGET